MHKFLISFFRNEILLKKVVMEEDPRVYPTQMIFVFRVCFCVCYHCYDFFNFSILTSIILKHGKYLIYLIYPFENQFHFFHHQSKSEVSL